MKWIVVVLVLLNLAAWLLGKRIDPVAQQNISADQAETINAEAMSVIQPAEEKAKRKVDEALALQEESLAQLKVDKRGQVLMEPAASTSAPVQAEKSPPANKPIVVTSNSSVAVAQDRSKPDIPAEPEQKPITLKKKPVPKPEPKPEPEPGPQASAQAALACYRLGPFTDQNSLAGVRRALENNGIEYVVDESAAGKKIKAVRVYMGAYGSTAAMEADARRLKSMNVEHYIITSNSTPLVQLGYFIEPARAKAYQKTLKARGIDAKAETIYHEARIDSWLDVRMATKSAVQALDLPKAVGVKEQACR
ncbi:MAG: hypothetical protein GY726_15795 [Proteobacteria bacterium]|nr:hypothetical protein [Pseudomonadota bacterium]